MTRSTHSKLIRGFAALVVCILLAVPAVAEGKFWTDPKTGDTWTTDPQVCGPRAEFGISPGFVFGPKMSQKWGNGDPVDRVGEGFYKP